MSSPPSPPRPTRLVLAEDNYLVREGTRALLQDSGKVTVVAAVPDATALRRAVDELDPDVVITDIRMPPDNHLDGIVAAHDIRARHPQVGVVVLSQHLEDDYALELFRHGTSGLAYLLKERIGDLGQVLHAIDEVRAGRSVLDPDVVDALIASRMPSKLADHGLTPRELEVLHHMAQGKTNPAIARDLHLSDSAIEKNINSIFAKLGLRQEPLVHHRVKAVLAYLELRG
jgi:DNA-binding NarL/FixJ family response regulator